VFWGQFSIAAGPHLIESAAGFQAWAYGMGDYNSYAFPLGYGPAVLSTGIDAVINDRPFSHVIVVPSGSLIDRPRLGLSIKEELLITDATGRLVSVEPPSSSLVVSFAPGSYVIRDAGASPRLGVRLLVH
jgi:hypothetical protein